MRMNGFVGGREEEGKERKEKFGSELTRGKMLR